MINVICAVTCYVMILTFPLIDFLNFSVLQVRDVSCGYGFTVFAASNEENDFTLFGTGLNSDFQIGYHCAKKSKFLCLNIILI